MEYYSAQEIEKLKNITPANSTISFEKLSSYFSITAEALQKVDDAGIKKDDENANDFWVMAVSYFSDAKHFALEKNDFVLAFGALNYAHAWLDAGVRIGFFNVKDSRLFTVDDEE